MKIEVHIPDEETAQEFESLKPPPGVKIIRYSTVLHGDGGIGFTTFVLEFVRDVGSGVLAGLILAGFSKYKKKHPDAKTTVNYRETRLEHTEIFRVIEEVRTIEYEPEQKETRS